MRTFLQVFLLLFAIHVQSFASDTITSGMNYFARPKGVFHGLTLLVDFSDQPAVRKVQEVDDWLNKLGFNVDGNNGSVRDFFLDISNQQFDYQNKVYGYYRASHPKVWYDTLNNGGLNYRGSDSLLKEVLDYFDPTVDFSEFDNNGDNFTDAINIVYTGPQGVFSRGLWPHTSSVGQQRDGVVLVQYQMTNLTGTFTLGTFAHESGHMIFGWPDLYYFGDYCLMGEGATVSPKDPVPVNDFYRAAQGWIPYINVNEGTILSTEIAASAIGYNFPNPNNPKEGYFWSYEQAWRRRSYMGGTGILIIHYNMNEIMGNTSPTRLQLRLMEASGSTALLLDKMPNPGHYVTDFFNSTNADHFTDATWYDGAPTGLKLMKIGNPGATISFSLEGSGVVGIRRPIHQNVSLAASNNYRDLLGRISPASVK